MTRPPVVMFCSVPYGLGHWARTAALASELRRRFDVTLLIGGRFSPQLQIPSGVTAIPLPMKYRGESDGIVCPPGLSLREVNQACNRIIQETVRRVMPVAVIVEYFPFGHWDNWSEVLCLIETAKYPLYAKSDAPAPVAICSLRDIQETRRPHQQYFDSEVCEMANAMFDAIWVHSDPAFAALEDTFPLAHRLRIPVFHTGFVIPDEQSSIPQDVPPEPVVLVSAGSGLAGESLLRLAIETYKTTNLARDFRMSVVVGVFQPDQARMRLEEAAEGVVGLELLRWAPDLRLRMARAAVSVSRCGYNTALDVLRSKTPSLLVPHVTLYDGEQTNRAQRLERCGAARFLSEEDATPSRLASEIRETAAFRPKAVSFNFSGASGATALMTQMLGERGFQLNNGAC